MLRMGRTRSERASGRRGRERIATDAPRIARRSKHRNILSMRRYGSAPVLSGMSVIIMLIGPSGKDRSFRLRRKLLQMNKEKSRYGVDRNGANCPLNRQWD